MRNQTINKAVTDFIRIIALGVAACEVLALTIFAICGKFSPAVLLGALWGGATMILHYYLMAYATAKAAEVADPDEAKKRVQLSHSKRLALLVLLMGAGVFLAAEYEILHWLPLVLSMIYPRISIAVWQIFNSKKLKAGDTAAEQLEPIPYTEEDEEDDL